MSYVLLLFLVVVVAAANSINNTSSSLRYALFIGHRVNWDITLKALLSSIELGPTNIRLIDMSGSTSLSTNPSNQVPEGVIVLDTPITPLSFSQMQEYMRKSAINEGLDVYFWIHSDVILSKGTATKALESVEVMSTIDPNWGILFFSYDLFCAFNVEAIKNLSWDTYIPHYKADYDYYLSMHLSNHTMYSGTTNDAFIPMKSKPQNVPWPLPGSIKHVSHGSVLMREMRENAAEGSSISNNNNKKNSEITPEQLWGYWITDYVGRYIYFLLKWGYNWPNVNPKQEHFGRAYSGWAWLRIILRLPSPGMDDMWWNILKAYIVISLMIIPMLFLVLLSRMIFGCWASKLRKNQQQHHRLATTLCQTLPLFQRRHEKQPLKET